MKSAGSIPGRKASKLLPTGAGAIKTTPSQWWNQTVSSESKAVKYCLKAAVKTGSSSFLQTKAKVPKHDYLCEKSQPVLVIQGLVRSSLRCYEMTALLTPRFPACLTTESV
jgi:hypothetical protein